MFNKIQNTSQGFTLLNSRKTNLTGFTLIELLITITIIVLISTIVFFDHRARRNQLALQRSAHTLAQDIRRVQEMAMRAEDHRNTPSRGGFGIHLVSATSTYHLFADCNGNSIYNATGTAISCETATATNHFREGLGLIARDLNRVIIGSMGRSLDLTANVTIHSISPSSPLTIIFVPPDPTVRIMAGGVATTTATITLGVNVGGITHTKNVIVNDAGRIFVE